LVGLSAKAFANAYGENRLNRAVKVGPDRALYWVAWLVMEASIADLNENIEDICTLIRLAENVPPDAEPMEKIPACEAFVDH
jgi:hypothetical protein